MSAGYFDFTLLPLGTPLFVPSPTSGASGGFSGFVDFTGLASGQAFIPPVPPPPTGFLGLVDFTGLPTGSAFVTLAPLPVGFVGLLDFTGLPTGGAFAPVITPVVAGFFGFIDFTGLPVGGTIAVPIPLIPTGHGFRGAGKLPYYIWIQVLARRRQAEKRNQERQVLQNKLIQEFRQRNTLTTRLDKKAIEDKKKVEATIWNIVLGEI